ncbi:OsmC family protein [Leifsonia kafniensis]|uniref:OsmC family protein n=1 Tax=Leifsonia kafniensis TaxID=475957 RepID=A0ABP7L5S4_9MICO
MQPSTLREVQEPIKQRYRDDPDAALVTLAADGTLGMGQSCSVQTGQALVRAGLHPATGGDGLLVCSGDMLLQALVACAGVTLGAVASALGLVVSGTVRAEGDLDFRGTLAVEKTAPVGFREIRLTFALESEADDDKLATLMRLTERYCVVFQTLAVRPALSVTHARSNA